MEFGRVLFRSRASLGHGCCGPGACRPSRLRVAPREKNSCETGTATALFRVVRRVAPQPNIKHCELKSLVEFRRRKKPQRSISAPHARRTKREQAPRYSVATANATDRKSTRMKSRH